MSSADAPTPLHRLEERAAERAAMDAAVRNIRDRLVALQAGLSDEDAARLAARLFAAPSDDQAQAVAEAWRMGVIAAMNTMAGRHICRICGCWELEACEGGCSWAEDDLCSACNVGGG